MSRFLAVLLFATAAGCAALAGAGLSIAPHFDSPRLPAAHDHALTMYRFPFVVGGGALLNDRTMAAYRFSLFRQQLESRGSSAPRFTSGWAIVTDLAIPLMALLVVAAAAPPRPVRRTEAPRPSSPAASAQWHGAVPLAPPRTPSRQPVLA